MSIMKDAQMKILQSLGSQEIHTLINHSDQFESTIDWESLYRILPLPKTYSFLLLGKFDSPIIVYACNIFLLKFYYPSTGLFDICLMMHSAFI